MNIFIKIKSSLLKDEESLSSFHDKDDTEKDKDER
jgi:hypothetical protein